LTLVFAILFFLVLFVGGISLYRARSIFLSTNEIRRESEQIDLVDRIHSTIHHLISDIQRSILRGTSVPDAERKSYLHELNALLELYQAGSETERDVAAEMGEIIADLSSLSERMVREAHVGREVNPQDLETLESAEAKIRALAHRLSTVHRAKMGQIVQESRWRMQLILGLYGLFILVGGFLIVGSSFYFSRTIAQPLRWLARGASEIAQGHFYIQVPVLSKDEIGQLSSSFNVMAERLREHEERLKGLAALEERGRIAQELHDSLAQEIALLHLKIIEANQALLNNSALKARGVLEEMRKIAEGAYEDVRQAIFGLRTMVSKRLGLIPSLTEYLHEFSELRQIPVDLKADGLKLIRLLPQVEIQLVRIIHEALTNVYKHAEAKKAVVRFDPDGEFVKVTIEDDGKGFQMEEVIGKRLHFGLQTMRERVEGVGGKFAVETAPGRGARVIVHLPFEERVYETYSRASG
jgi:signal transduction histidine kinase